MAPIAEFWISALLNVLTGIILLLLAALVLFWIVEIVLRRPIEHYMKIMLKNGKITKNQFEEFEKYMWWNYGRGH